MDNVSTNPNATLPSLDGLKQQAKRLRTSLANDGVEMGHSQSLEQIAHQYGFRDWNTLYASVGNEPPAFAPFLGQRVSGRYLGHAFDAEIIAVQFVQRGERYRVTFRFDEAVDVVAFEGMTSFRKQVTATVGGDGKTAEKTSNGVPHLVLSI